jgi:hypothetical protein
MTKYPYEKRLNRAMWGTYVLLHYARQLWKARCECYPPLGLIEIIKLAEQHTHNWVWGYIGYNDIYLPRKRVHHAEADQG